MIKKKKIAKTKKYSFQSKGTFYWCVGGGGYVVISTGPFYPLGPLGVSTMVQSWLYMGLRVKFTVYTQSLPCCVAQNCRYFLPFIMTQDWHFDEVESEGERKKGVFDKKTYVYQCFHSEVFVSSNSWRKVDSNLEPSSKVVQIFEGILTNTRFFCSRNCNSSGNFAWNTAFL